MEKLLRGPGLVTRRAKEKNTIERHIVPAEVYSSRYNKKNSCGKLKGKDTNSRRVEASWKEL